MGARWTKTLSVSLLNPKMYLHYLKKYFSDQSIQKNNVWKQKHRSAIYRKQCTWNYSVWATIKWNDRKHKLHCIVSSVLSCRNAHQARRAHQQLVSAMVRSWPLLPRFGHRNSSFFWAHDTVCRMRLSTGCCSCIQLVLWFLEQETHPISRTIYALFSVWRCVNMAVLGL